VRVTFFDFSNAFNTLLGTKLLGMQVAAPLVAWITNHLTGRPQYVRLQSNMSDTIVSNTGAISSSGKLVLSWEWNWSLW